MACPTDVVHLSTMHRNLVKNFSSKESAEAFLLKLNEAATFLGTSLVHGWIKSEDLD